ncbi:hypothetical protein A1O1_08253 [Capronia coronata CBS 617.96]|uniref:D-xylose 1-dehydrogenase (NADP(+), D-xylono-1,5-lactone-forming) n=1 Tax=Capronia coronata CBS 617.96 TaxID=1182541 RepID=W9XSY5_9EURO|nr:uncharacterized protein A1O1_08253 [Capronia coronata CBS 617.96]EXJ80111.1 hypothetical protein A1O1_08253 [Capronia coronata CBS 617.96]
MTQPRVIRWGIIATGYIARTFAKDLLVDPRTRGVVDIRHSVVAVASSSSQQKAQDFIDDILGPGHEQKEPCTAYGSYDALLQDAAVDIVYVATPHSHHFQVCMLCLQKGKAVLCEKPLVVNAAQALALQKQALRHQTFLMEALWTRCLPISKTLRNYVLDGAVGEILRVSADLSIGVVPEDVFDPSHRMVNKDLAGGALLDLGIYNLSWIFYVLYNLRPPGQRVIPRVMGSAMTLDARTGVDEATTVLLDFPPPTAVQDQHAAHAIMTTAFRVDSSVDSTDQAAPTVRLQGTRGEILLYGPIYCPHRLRVVRKEQGPASVEQHDFPIPDGIKGMMYEADEAARCWVDGKLESDVMPWHESLAICQIMDEVRLRSNLTYPDSVETTVYHGQVD